MPPSIPDNDIVRSDVDEKLAAITSTDYVSTGNITLRQAMSAEPPRVFTSARVILYLGCLVAFFCSTSNGFDGSLFNSLLENTVFREYFHVQNVGAWTGIVTSIYSIGSAVAIPFVGPIPDTFGRRTAMTIGAALIVFGTVIQGTTTYTRSLAQFMAGRFFLGFGVAISASSGPMYVIEVSHPAHRGVMTGLYNTFWAVGSIAASGLARGVLFLPGNASWVTPVWGQMVFGTLIILFAWMIPESPRWLYVNNKKKEAKAMLTKYHGEGNPNSAWVKLQLQDYDEYLNDNGSDKRFWDYSALFRTRASCYRLFCNVTVTIFGQWAGNGVLGYYFSAVLDTAGYRLPVQQMNINLIGNCWGFVIAVLGALCVDRFGRRPLLIGSFCGCAVVWIGMSIATSQYAASIPPGSTDGLGTNTAAAQAALAMTFVFGLAYSFGITPLQALYPVEVLSFEMRAKGMAFSNAAVTAASLLNQFAWPIALQKIQWRTYIIFVVWCFIQAAVIYVFIPETKGRTLEELDDIFNSPNPRKKSLEKREEKGKAVAFRYEE